MSFPEITGNTMISNSINIPSAIAITDTLQTCNFANNFTGAQAVFNCTRDPKILGTAQYYTQYPGPNNVVTQVPSSFDTGKNIITGSQKNASNAKSNAGFNRSMPRKKDFVNRKFNGALVYKKTDPSTGLPFIPEIDNGEAVYHETVNRLLNVRVQGPPGSITSNFSVLSDFTVTAASIAPPQFDYFGYATAGVTGDPLTAGITITTPGGSLTPDALPVQYRSIVALWTDTDAVPPQPQGDVFLYLAGTETPEESGITGIEIELEGGTFLTLDTGSATDRGAADNAYGLFWEDVYTAPAGTWVAGNEYAVKLLTTNTGPARFVSSLMDNSVNPSVIDVDPVTGLKHLTQTRIVVASQEAGTDILVQPNSTTTKIPPATTDYVRRLGSDRLKCPTVNGVYNDAPTAACSQTFITPVFAGNSVMTNLARPMVANDRMNVTNFVTANIAPSIILPHP